MRLSPLSSPLLLTIFHNSIDGGVRRAGDIIKAVALGAKGVGLGRPLLYAYCAYGSEGVVRAIQLLKDEMEMKSVPSLSPLPFLTDDGAMIACDSSEHPPSRTSRQTCSTSPTCTLGTSTEHLITSCERTTSLSRELETDSVPRAGCNRRLDWAD